MHVARLLPLLAFGMAAYSPDNHDDWRVLKPEGNPPPGSFSTLSFKFGFIPGDYMDEGAPKFEPSSGTGVVPENGVFDSRSGGADVSLVSHDEIDSENNIHGALELVGEAPHSGSVSPNELHSVHDDHQWSKKDIVIKEDHFLFPVACVTDSVLQMELKDGFITLEGRVGSIVSSHQFQFDGPVPQHGALYAAGWLVTPDGLLCLGDSTLFYKCTSGDFYKLYDQSIGSQCTPVKLQIIELVSC